MPTEERRATRISKLLSYWLRHAPDAGLTLDGDGWTDVDAVRAALSVQPHETVSLAELEAVVRGSDKQRFSLIDGRVRANQGHKGKE